MAVTFNVNGASVTATRRRQHHCFWVIREQIKLTGTKFGCGTGTMWRLHDPH